MSWPKERIDELKALADKATPRPWSGDRYDGSIKYHLRGSDGTDVLTTDHKNGEYGFIGQNCDKDELFTVAACNSLESALDEITRLRLLVAELKEDAKFWYGECQGVIPDEEIELHRSLMSKVDEVMG